MTDTLQRDDLPAAAPARWQIPLLGVGPFSHLAAERDRLASLRWQHFDAEQIGVTVGAQISGVDLTGPLGDAVLSELRVALHDYKVSATTGPTPG
jgi:hypothetical protein